MPSLSFQVEGAEAVPYSASPLLNLKLRIKSDEPSLLIHNVLLQCQVQIEPGRREYLPSEQEQLRDLFGEPARWGRTLRSMLWANVSVVVPEFQGETVADVPVPCTFDFTVAATKYFHGLAGGDVPLCVFLSGTVFHAAEDSSLRISKISWDREAQYRLPISTWKQLMDAHYPNTAWLCLRRDVFDRLYRYKVSRGIPTWEQTVESILASAEQPREDDMPKVRA